MALPGEVGNDGKTCTECNQVLKMAVCRSAAGYYLGTRCLCGPYSRESYYFASEKDANDALAAYHEGRAGAFLRALG